MLKPREAEQDMLNVHTCKVAKPTPDAMMPIRDFSYILACLILSLIVLTIQVKIVLKRIMYIIAK